MSSTPTPNQAGARLTSSHAGVLSSSTKSAPIWSPRSPRWILEFLRVQANVPVEGGRYQVNRVAENDQDNGLQVHTELQSIYELSRGALKATHSHPDTTTIVRSAGLYATDVKTASDLNDAPNTTAALEIKLHTVQSIVEIPNRVPALYSDHHDQLQEQLNLASEFIYETVEYLVFNHQDYGLLRDKNISARMRFEVETVATPDVLDDLLARAWRRPDLFVMHPEMLAEFRKEANARSLTLEEVDVFGSPFTAWRGLPIVPSNKIPLLGKEETIGKPGARVEAKTTTHVLLMRLGEAKQGVVHLSAKGAETGPRLPGINIEFMGLSDQAVARYLLTTYTGVAVLSGGGLARAQVNFTKVKR